MAPAELTDRIIDFLHSDKHTLSACSLVRKSWIPASRYHLFRELTITRAKAQSLLNLFGSTTTKDDTGANGEPSPSISNKTKQLPKGLEVFSYVQSVSWSWITYNWDGTSEATLADSVMQIVASFPRLSEFILADRGNLPGPTLRYLRNIKKFSNHSGYAAGIAIVIANNPGLEWLGFTMSWGDDGFALHSVIPPNSPPLKLRHLSVTGFVFHPIITSHLRSLTSLEWLERSLDSGDRSAELWQTLKSEKIQLSKLKTSLIHDSLLEFLSSFQGMTDLRLESIMGEDYDDSNRLARTLLQVVCLHHADTLETFHLNAYRPNHWHFEHPDITPILNCTNLKELGTTVYWRDDLGSPDGIFFRLLNSTPKLPRLRLLQIAARDKSDTTSKMIHDFISTFDPCIDGVTRIPVSKVYAGGGWFEWREGKYQCTSVS